MKFAVIVVILLIALLLLLGIIGLAGLWFGGGKTIFLPGLHLVIATPLLIASFIALEVIVLLVALMLWRFRLVNLLTLNDIS